MTSLYFFISCVVFVEFILFSNLMSDATKLIAGSRDAMVVMTSSELDDESKEILLRKASLTMFKNTAILAMKIVFLGIILYAMFRLFVAFLPELRAPITESILSPIVLLGMTLVAMSYAWVRNVIFK